MMSNRAITTDYGIEYVEVEGGFIISLFIGQIVIGLFLIGLSEVKILQELVNKQNGNNQDLVVEDRDIHINKQSN